MPDTRFRYDLIPPWLMDDLVRWVRTGRPVSGFLTAILKNNLRNAVENADLECLPVIPTVVCWLVNKAPMGCWGSEENYRNWRGYEAWELR